MKNPTPEALLLIKVVVKIYFVSIQYKMADYFCVPASVTQWIQLFGTLVGMQVAPPSAGDEDRDELAKRPVWKVKKWSVRILKQMFERYGVVSNAEKRYKEFAKYFTATFTVELLQLMVGQLKKIGPASGEYIAPKVALEILRYLGIALSPKETWALIKPGVPMLLSETIFPLLCLSDEDAILYKDDPPEYIKRKFDMMSDTYVAHNHTRSSFGLYYKMFRSGM